MLLTLHMYIIVWLHVCSVEVQVDESGASDDEDPQEELSALIEEANVPLQSLLAKYGAATVDGDHQGTLV